MADELFDERQPKKGPSKRDIEVLAMLRSDGIWVKKYGMSGSPKRRKMQLRVANSKVRAAPHPAPDCLTG